MPGGRCAIRALCPVGADIGLAGDHHIESVTIPAKFVVASKCAAYASKAAAAPKACAGPLIRWRGIDRRGIERLGRVGHDDEHGAPEFLVIGQR